MTQTVRVAISAVLLLAALVVIQFRSFGESVQARRSFDSFPEAVGSWKGREDTVLGPPLLSILKVSDYLLRRYADPSGHNVWLYIAYWQSQRKGADVHSPRNCLPGGGWEPVEASRLKILVDGSSTPITVNRYLIQKDNQMQVVIYWFQAQGTVVAGELEAKIEMIRSAIVKKRTDGALVRVSSPVHGSVQETTDRLTQYVQALYPALGDYVPR